MRGTGKIMQTVDGRSAELGSSAGRWVDVRPVVGKWRPGTVIESWSKIGGLGLVTRFVVGARRGKWVRLTIVGARLDGNDIPNPNESTIRRMFRGIAAKVSGKPG